MIKQGEEDLKNGKGIEMKGHYSYPHNLQQHIVRA